MITSVEDIRHLSLVLLSLVTVALHSILELDLRKSQCALTLSITPLHSHWPSRTSLVTRRISDSAWKTGHEATTRTFLDMSRVRPIELHSNTQCTELSSSIYSSVTHSIDIHNSFETAFVYITPPETFHHTDGRPIGP